MSNELKIELVPEHKDTWSSRVEKIRHLLGAPENPWLFPPHFLKSVFPKLGGKIVQIKRSNHLVAVGFLFPRELRGQSGTYTCRLHPIGGGTSLDQNIIADKICQTLSDCKLIFYFPEADHHYEKSALRFGEFEIGRCDRNEAEQVRSMQQVIWGYSNDDQDYLYPSDIHSRDFGLGSSLIVRCKGEPAGFLFGFYKFDNSAVPVDLKQHFNTNFRIESQLLGVLPKFRGKGLGRLLKMMQAFEAQKMGIHIINWTFDPLQVRNAILNFSELGGISYDFYPDYYQFQNQLNQVTSSRLGVTWLIDSGHVDRRLNQTHREIYHIDDLPGVKIVNHGIDECFFEAKSEKIAVEIPHNWTELQQEDPETARKWREVTDKLFKHYLGHQTGKYMVSDVAKKGKRYYLIGEKVQQVTINKILA